MANFLQQFSGMLDGLEDGDLKTSLVNAYANVKLDFNQAIDKRNDLKSELRDYKQNIIDLTGSEDISKVKELIDSSKATPNDDIEKIKSELAVKHEAQLAELRTTIEAEQGKYSELSSSHESMLFEREVENQGLLKGFEIENPRVKAMLLDEIKSNTIFENGQFFVKDSTTGDKSKDIHTNEFLKASSITDSMLQADEWSSFVNPDVKANGGGTPPNQNTGTPTGLKRSNMSHSEKATYQKEHGADAYLKLPN